ncbi:MAG: hypothetical protein PVF18_11730 [Anaerolineales bacterium]|jgi:hypothetical protein
MNKSEFLTIRWNNILSLGLSVPTLAYITFAFMTDLWISRSGLIGLASIGVVY